MKDTLYYLTAAGFIFLSLFCLGIILRGLTKVLAQIDFPAALKKQIFGRTIVLFAGVIVLASILSLTGFTTNFSFLPPRPALIGLSLFILFTGLIFTPTLTKILQNTPPEWILYLQSFRIIVEILLWLLFIQNLLPIQMTFEGRNWDILSGIAGPIVAYYCLVKKSWSVQLVFWYNIIGLGLLFNILAVAVLSMPTPIRLFMNEPANTIVGQFPFIFLPNVLVPIAYVMHLFSLRQLYLQKK